MYIYGILYISCNSNGRCNINETRTTLSDFFIPVRLRSTGTGSRSAVSIHPLPRSRVFYISRTSNIILYLYSQDVSHGALNKYMDTTPYIHMRFMASSSLLDRRSEIIMTGWAHRTVQPSALPLC